MSGRSGSYRHRTRGVSRSNVICTPLALNLKSKPNPPALSALPHNRTDVTVEKKLRHGVQSVQPRQQTLADGVGIGMLDYGESWLRLCPRSSAAYLVTLAGVSGGWSATR